MPLRNAKPLTFRPTTVCDSQDMTNGPPGGMAALTNLIPNPATDKTWVPRPAAQLFNNFAGFSSPGFVSAWLVVGNYGYGMIASNRNPGHDEPFAINIATNTFLTVNGITAANTPVSPPTSGPWQPPIMAQVGTRIIVTHPGFLGGAAPYFGWFDVSSFSEATFGNTTIGSPVITGNPFIFGVQPGLLVSGAGIPVGSSVVSAANFVLDTTGTTSTDIHLTGLASTTGVDIGQTVAGAGIPTGAVVTALVSPSAVDISLPTTASASGIAITFAGATITISQDATATADNVPLTLQGGSQAAPLWGAGNTNGNPLIAPPVSVAQMAGSAFYAVGAAVIESDPLLPTQVTNAGQVLTFGNGIPVTALGPLPLNSLLGGIVQAIIAFQGNSAMQQITGTFALSNLAVNQMPLPTGTLAPLTVVPMMLGLAFVSPEGLRIVSFTAQISDPIGDHGQGLTIPFIYSEVPSRMCAAATADTLRITTQNAAAQGTPFQEFWWDLTRKVWSGPHTFPASLIQAWMDTFIMTGVGINARLWQSDGQPNSNTSFIESGAQMGCYLATSLLPDTDAMAENAIVETNLMIALPKTSQAAILAVADDGTFLSSIILFGISGNATIWGQFVWGQAYWGAQGLPPLIQRQIKWTAPLVFKQMGLTISVNAAPGIVIGNFYLRYQILGYLLERAS